MTGRLRQWAVLFITGALLLRILAGCDIGWKQSPSGRSATGGPSAGQTPGGASPTASIPRQTSTRTASTATREPEGSGPISTPDPGVDPESEDPDPGGEEDPNSGGDTDPVINLGGRTVTIAMWPAYTPADDGSVQAWLRAASMQKYNFNIVYDETSGRSDKLYLNFISAFLSGLWYADVIMINGGQAFPYMVLREMIHPLDDYVSFTGGPYANIYQANTYWKGRHYGIQEGLIMPLNMMTFNRDLISAAGQPDPLTLQQQGAWNVDWLRMISQACVSDLNGDGINDVWGISMKQEVFTANMLHANGCDYTRLVDGRYVFALDEPAAMWTMNFISELIHYYRVANADEGKAFKEGRAVFISEVLRLTPQMPKNCGVVYYPLGPNGTGYVNIATQTPFFAFPVISNFNITRLAPALADMWAYWDTAHDQTLGFYQQVTEWAATRACGEADIPVLADAALNRLKIPDYSNFMDYAKFCEIQIFQKLATTAPLQWIVDNAKSQAQAYLEQYN